DGGHIMTHLGYGADGFPVYGPHGYSDVNNANSELIDVRSSYQLKEGIRPDGPGGLYDGAFVGDFEYVEGLGDLDECNGRFGVTPEYPEGIYHYYITASFPFVPRCLKGTPDESFIRRGGSPNRQRPGDGPSGDRPPGNRPPNNRPPNNRPPGGPPPGNHRHPRPGGPPGGRPHHDYAPTLPEKSLH
ncbi:MAG: YHYH protein, partial [Cyanobacteria bacterium J06632_3]